MYRCLHPILGLTVALAALGATVEQPPARDGVGAPRATAAAAPTSAIG